MRFKERMTPWWVGLKVLIPGMKFVAVLSGASSHMPGWAAKSFLRTDTLAALL